MCLRGARGGAKGSPRGPSPACTLVNTPGLFSGIDCVTQTAVQPETAALRTADLRSDCSARYGAVIEAFSLDSVIGKFIRELRRLHPVMNFREIKVLREKVVGFSKQT